MTRIATQLSMDAVLTALRDMVPASQNLRLFQSGFEGEIDPQRLSVAYRFGWFVPPVRVATFRGRGLDASHGTTIEGAVSSNWIVHLLTGWFFVAVPVSLFRYASVADYSTAFWIFATAAVVLYLGRAYVRVTHQHIIDEICRAARGKVADD